MSAASAAWSKWPCPIRMCDGLTAAICSRVVGTWRLYTLGTHASVRNTLPAMATAKLETPNQEKMTRSSRTAPVVWSTLWAPNTAERAETSAVSA